jgi:hypothetical protein
MMDLRKKIYIGASIVVGFLIILLIYFISIREMPEEQKTPTGEIPEETSEQETPTGTEAAPSVEVRPVATPPQIAPEDNYIRQIARLFVERFGSYSNQNNNQHIDSVIPLVTNSMARWIRTQTVEQNGDYEGVTTKVIVNTIEDLSDTQALVHIEVQELIETRTTRETNYRTGEVTLVFEQGDWKVSGLFWEE